MVKVHKLTEGCGERAAERMFKGHQLTKGSGESGDGGGSGASAEAGVGAEGTDDTQSLPPKGSPLRRPRLAERAENILSAAAELVAIMGGSTYAKGLKKQRHINVFV